MLLCYIQFVASGSPNLPVIPLLIDVLQGLEREYDRLLAENDGLKRRLARFDAGFSAADKKSA
jgi:hypothetical protein